MLFLSACVKDDGLGRRPVSGFVTLDGTRLSGGTVMFEPVSTQTGTMVGASIRNGEFSIDRREGPVPGSYRIRIYASSKTQAAPPAGKSDRSARPLVELIPARYNSQTILKTDVTLNGKNRFRFDLTSTDSDVGAR